VVRLAIKSVRARVSQGEAIDVFSGRSVSAYFWHVHHGPLRRIADAYVPYSIYCVRYALRNRTETRLFALDTVDGSLDVYEFAALPGLEELVAVETRNFLPPSLTEEHAEDLLREKVLRVIFQQGFLKSWEDLLEIVGEPVNLYIPYWLGFYDGRGTVRCRVMDAVRRQVEGAKAAALFEQWLAA
jgi:hypothetical protein